MVVDALQRAVGAAVIDAEQAGAGHTFRTVGLAGARSVSGFGVYMSDMVGSGVTLATDGDTQLGFLRQLQDPVGMFRNGWDAFVDSPTDEKGYAAITILAGAPRTLRSLGVPDRELSFRRAPSESPSPIGAHNENMFNVHSELGDAQFDEVLINESRSTAPVTVARLENHSARPIAQPDHPTTPANPVSSPSRPRWAVTSENSTMNFPVSPIGQAPISRIRSAPSFFTWS